MSVHYSYIGAPNLFIQYQNGKRYAYRELGKKKNPNYFIETTMNQKDSTVPVVTMNLELDQAISYDLFHYF